MFILLFGYKDNKMFPNIKTITNKMFANTKLLRCLMSTNTQFAVFVLLFIPSFVPRKERTKFSNYLRLNQEKPPDEDA